MLRNNIRVILAMSGGVDSSVAAWLLQQEGYIVEGLFMKNWEEDDTETFCSMEKDFFDAKIICKSLRIPLYYANFSDYYWEKVFIPCIKEYKKGFTPNPDVICNKEIKFNIFWNFAFNVLNADYIATGHYARKYLFNKKYFLLKSLDLQKDQTYFLYELNHQKLIKILFPIGKYKKTHIRNIARKLNFINAKKKDSMGICFIGKKNFNKFISKYIEEDPGLIIDEYKNIIGKHKGLFNYTIGQRKGINVKNYKNFKKPFYVIDKKIKENILMVAEGNTNKKLYSWGLIAKNINWINCDINNCTKTEFDIKIRHSIETIPAFLQTLTKDTLKIKFKFPVRGVTPGQSVVIYMKDTCLGGGIIYQRLNFQ